MVMRAAVLVDHRPGWVVAPDGRAHEMARSPKGVRRLLHELVFGVVDAEQLEHELVELEDGLEALSDIAVIVVETIVDLRPRDAEIVELVVRQGDAIVADRE